jgi:hypothetical protein
MSCFPLRSTRLPPGPAFPLGKPAPPADPETAVVFDTGQPHGVISRRSGGLDAADFLSEQDCTQVLPTWALTVEEANLERMLRIDFGIGASNALLLGAEQVWMNGPPGSVCPETGRWPSLG